ncbi:MAG: YcbK family protein [Hyphomicrobiaceae bacterium]
MSDRVPHRCLAASAGLFALVAASAFIGIVDVAKADTAEYLAGEFRTERPTVTASLSSIDDEDARPARRQAPRPSITRSHDDRPARKRHSKAHSHKKHVRVASLGKTYVPPSKPHRSIAGGGSIKWAASSGCLNGSLRGVLAQVASRFGSVTVNSTCRSRSRNARVGGARRSKHLTGDAADFRINGNWGAASSFIRGLVGGFKHYGGGLFHIDTGPRRTW